MEKKFGKGDIVWLDFAPTAGREQSGYRPAVVISPEQYNSHGLMIVCPMTTKRRGYPFEVPAGKGTVLVDQLRSVDWRARNARKKGKVTTEVLRKISHLLGLLLPS